MLSYIEYLTQQVGAPVFVGVSVVVVLVASQVIGELLELKGKVVPEFMKFRKFLARKKRERETVRETAEMVKEVKSLLSDVRQHYNADNIRMRDEWMKTVNEDLAENKHRWQELSDKLDKNTHDTVAILVDSKRSAIINFASRVVNPGSAFTKEEFNRIFKLHKEYEGIIKENGMTNGEVDIAIRIITESYENHMRDHSFIEDIRGYEV